MDDINFDELDKAVASAAQTGTPAQEGVQPARSLSQSDTTRSSTSAPSFAAKRRGQFMDMVHPSSDMSKASTITSGIRRQAPAVQPLSPSIVETSSTLADMPSVDEQATQAPVEEVSETVPATAVDYSWPDPIDASRVSPEKQDEESTVDTVTVETVENSFMDTTSVNDESRTEVDVLPSSETSVDNIESESTSEPETHESPFVEGAAVEKRPLGAFTDPASGESAASEPLDTVPVADPEARSIESSEATEEPTVEVETVSPVNDSGTAEAEQGETPEVPTEQPVGAPEIQPSQPDEGVAQSIPQQYRTEEETTVVDSDEHAVFDTESYHQPLPLPEKQRGSHKLLLYTLLAVLMLAIGAAAGYAIFVLKLL